MTDTQIFKRWKQFARDDTIARELTDIEKDSEAIAERFHTALSFGTAGLRAKMGAGTSRMNIYTVGQATQGLADYAAAHGGQQRGMVVAYDTRINSDVFARRTAAVLAANGVKTYLFKEPTSVPELSFAIRKLGAFGGVAITASHNPKEYNGYKVYAPWGGQLLEDASLEVTKKIDAVDMFEGVKCMDIDEAVAAGRVQMLGAEMDEAYYEMLAGLVQNPQLVRAEAQGVRFVYTPLFGTGMRTFEGVMKKLPYSGVVVESQRQPNGAFPALAAPNPEKPDTLREAMLAAQRAGADLVIGTDPDADRMGAAVPAEDGEFTMLTGNQTACLIIDYLLRQRKQAGLLKKSDFIVKSFVSTRMADAIAHAFGIGCATVPTGFKYVADMIHNRYPDRHFVFGFEESCGFLAGGFLGDKDGMIAALLLLEVLCECKAQGETLLKRLERLGGEYGWHKEMVVDMMLEGSGGMEKKARIMAALREKPPAELGGQRVLRVTDYLGGIQRDSTGEHAIDFPRSDAVGLDLESGWVMIRPSGTEPKVRAYFGVNASTKQASEMQLETLRKDAAALLDI